MDAIRIIGLRKSYQKIGRRQVALDGLDLIVPDGGVHGLLGPNGSGKTTTLRIALGLMRADGGTIELLGRQVPRELTAVAPLVGALIEGPRLFPQWSGRYNLHVLAQIAGVSPARVEECLQLAGMDERGDVPFKDCSLGMKQRLAIAAALLKSPRLLVLDEPGNGLDPAGIHDIRNLITTVARSGDTTVVVSSHQLAEVEQMCDHLSIVAEGKLVASGSVAEIAGRRASADLAVDVSDPEIACGLLRSAGFDATVDADGVFVRAPREAAEVTRVLTSAGHAVSAVIPQRTGLEESFLALTSRGQL